MSDIKKPGATKAPKPKHEQAPTHSINRPGADKMPLGLMPRRPPIETKGQADKTPIKRK